RQLRRRPGFGDLRARQATQGGGNDIGSGGREDRDAHGIRVWHDGSGSFGPTYGTEGGSSTRGADSSASRSAFTWPVCRASATVQTRSLRSAQASRSAWTSIDGPEYRRARLAGTTATPTPACTSCATALNDFTRTR